MKMKQKKALLKQLESIEDFREHEGKIIYPLSEIIFITLFGILYHSPLNTRYFKLF